MNWLSDLIYRTKYRFFKRDAWRHVVTPGLKPGYCDQRERILHAVMALVVDYVEEETLDTLRWRADPETYEDFPEERRAEEAAPYVDIIRVYEYWTKRRAEMEAAMNVAANEWGASHRFRYDETDETFHGEKCFAVKSVPADGHNAESVKRMWTKYSELSDEFDATEQEMLELAVRHRRHMWV